MNRTSKKSIKYFLSGLLFLIPVFIVWQIFKSISGVVKTFNSDIHGFWAFFISLTIIFLTGFLISKFFKSSLRARIIKKSKDKRGFSAFYKFIANYKSISEKTKKSFSKPIFYQSSEGIEKIGFITNENLAFHKDKVAVYVPNPVNFLGELIFINKDLIKEIPKEEKHNITVMLLSAGIIHKDYII